MRLLVMTEFFPLTPEEGRTGGVEQRVSQLVSRLPGVDVTILCSRRPGQLRYHRYGLCRVKRVGPAYPYSNSGHIIKRLLFACSLVIHALRGPRPSVIEGASFLGYLPASIAGLLRRVPRIATYHECWLGQWIRIKGLGTGLFGEVWERLSLFFGFDAIIAVSDATRQQLAAKNIRTTVVIPNGVTVARRRHVPPQHPTISYVGRLVEGKRVDVLLRAAATLQRDIKDISVIIVGDGSERERLESLASQLGVHARFTGFLPSDDDVQRVVATSSVFCLPSAIEGFGLTAIEAMACGVPVVLADIPALREISGEGEAALLAPVGDVPATARALRQALTDSTRRRQLLDGAQKQLRRYDWDTLAAAYRRAILSL